MGEIVGVGTGARWYDHAGKIVQGATLREARKELLMASITSILREKAKPNLVSWQIEQGILAALTLPRLDGESSDDYARRVAKDAQEQAGNAADLGTLVHDAIAYHLCEKFAIDYRGWKTQHPMAEEPKRWLDEHVETAIMVECGLAHPEEGYAGTADMYVKLKDQRYAVIDIKTQKSKEGKKFEKYPEYGYQLAAQRELILRTGGHVDVCGNMFVSTTEPGRMEVVWWKPEDIDNGWLVFRALRDVFYLSRKYDWRGGDGGKEKYV
jgi:hypothetical protein